MSKETVVLAYNEENIPAITNVVLHKWESLGGRIELNQLASRSMKCTRKSRPKKGRKNFDEQFGVCQSLVKEAIETLETIKDIYAIKTANAWKDAETHVAWACMISLNRAGPPDEWEEIIPVDTHLVPVLNGYGIAIVVRRKEKDLKGCAFMSEEIAHPESIKAWNASDTPTLTAGEITAHTSGSSLLTPEPGEVH